MKNCTIDSCYPNVTCFKNSGTISCGPCPLGLSGDGKNCQGDYQNKKIKKYIFHDYMQACEIVALNTEPINSGAIGLTLFMCRCCYHHWCICCCCYLLLLTQMMIAADSKRLLSTAIHLTQIPFCRASVQ